MQGALIIIDGADEAGISASEKILNDARILCRTWPSTSIIISSRPLPIFSNIEEAISIPLLSDDDIKKLILRVAKVEVTSGMLAGLEPSIRNAISRPFFALLWSIYLHNDQTNILRTKGELISYLVEKSVVFSADNIRRALDLLETLGAKTIDASGAYVIQGEIGSITDITLLLETRLVEKKNGLIGFPLPIMAQWFAANSLLSRKVDVHKLTEDLPRLDRWRYPLVIVVSQFSYEHVSEIITSIVESAPGIAAEIISEATDSYVLENEPTLPSARECAQRLRTAHTAWISGLGNLAPFISPISPEGNLLPIGVATTENRLMASWYHGSEINDEIIELPVGYFGQNTIDQGWHKMKYALVGSQPAWVWRWSLDDLVDNLDTLLREQAFLIDGGFIHQEQLWEHALRALGHGDLHQKPISLEKLEPAVARKLETFENPNPHWQELQNLIILTREAGQTELKYPWPEPDIDSYGGWLWNSYSDEQILNRARVVFSSALEEYSRIIEKYFIALKSRMLIATLLPATMVGTIRFSDTRFDKHSPGIDWYFEPLSLDKQSCVEINLADKPSPIDVYALLQKNRRMRPQASEWITSFVSHGFLRIFQVKPVSEIVYRWLKDDLRRINWTTEL